MQEEEEEEVEEKGYMGRTLKVFFSRRDFNWKKSCVRCRSARDECVLSDSHLNGSARRKLLRVAETKASTPCVCFLTLVILQSEITVALPIMRMMA